MKRIKLLPLLLVFCFALVSCTLAAPKEVTFNIEKYGITVIGNDNFEESTSGSWDLQITNQKVNISIMVFNIDEIVEDGTQKSIYDLQNKDLLSKRENTTTAEAETITQMSDKKITKTVFSGDRDGIKNYYASYLIEFSNSETFAWGLINGTPEDIGEDLRALEEILLSAKIENNTEL